jgi:hypothetical protein
MGNQPLSRELLTQVLYEIIEGKLNPIREEISFIEDFRITDNFF